MATEKLSIDLPGDVAQMVRRAVDGGEFVSSSDVITDALRLWQGRQLRAESLRAGLNAAAADATRYSDEDVSAHLDRLLDLAEASPAR